MDPVKRQYETYPYPARDPADEAKRLIVGTPSNPLEIDHFFHGGARDWSQPFRALVAGGGTGDALIMLAQRLADVGCPAEITYLDMSTASREIAEARAKVRGLTNIRFLTGDLLTAPELGPFDYIDCCGVLHHLPNPQAGFDALSAALGPDGGMGLMVYAPLGRTGVYPMQDALRALCGEDEPESQVALAKKVLAGLPPTNWLTRNEFVVDHKNNDAGLYDLLLHSRDRPYFVGELRETVEAAGLALVAFPEGARYLPETYLRDPDLLARAGRLDAWERAALAERLAGNIKLHNVYVAKAGRAPNIAGPTSPQAVPVMPGGSGAQVAGAVAKQGGLMVSRDGLKIGRAIAKAAAPLIAGIDGKRSLGEIAAAARLDWMRFSSIFSPTSRAMQELGVLFYSKTFG